MRARGESDATQFLARAAGGDRASAASLLPLVYEQLRHLAAAALRRERPDHTLQPTALVHEAFLRLIDQTHASYNSRTHFCAVASEAMRRVLVDHARAHRADKRGGGAARLPLDDATALGVSTDEELLAMDEALTRLAELDERQSRVVEMRFFGGLSVEEAAQALGVSPRTVELDWRMARAWLRRELSKGAK